MELPTCDYLKNNQDLAFPSLQSAEVVISPSASLDQTQPTAALKSQGFIFVPACAPSLRQEKELHSPYPFPFIFQSPWSFVSTIYPWCHPRPLPSPWPGLSEIATNPISLSTSICPFHHPTDLHEIFLPLPLLVLRNATKIRLKCSHIPRMQRFGRCCKRKLAGRRLMLTGNITKGKIQLWKQHRSCRSWE